MDKLIDNLEFSTNKSKLDTDVIIDFLHQHSYWAKERPIDVILSSIKNSLCIGVYHAGAQIGFARILTDYSTVFYLAELFVIPKYQGRGVGDKIMTYIDNIPELKKIRGMLTTRYAHEFYERHGYSREHLVVKERIMIKDPAE